jgi:hypothetical protein
MAEFGDLRLVCAGLDFYVERFTGAGFGNNWLRAERVHPLAAARIAELERTIDWAEREYANEHDAVLAEIKAAEVEPPDVVLFMAKMNVVARQANRTAQRRGEERDAFKEEVARLREDAARLDYLEAEAVREGQARQAGERAFPRSLFRENMPITRERIDAAMAAAYDEGGG